MKILLLTSCPPCQEYTGGQYLDRLVRFLPEDSVVCFAVTNQRLAIEMKLTADLSWIPIQYAERPVETSLWSLEDYRIRQPEAESKVTAAETLRRLLEVPQLVSKAVAFGEVHDVDMVLAVMEGQTLTHMALPVAQKLGVPLRTLVWDPLTWWLRDHRVDHANSAIALAAFDETLRRSQACAVASWAMAEEFTARFDIPAYALPVGLPSSFKRRPKRQLSTEDKLVIGMAGQFYASEEWMALVEMLDRAGWRVSGRDVTIIVLGRSEPPFFDRYPSIDYRGWKGASEVVTILSDEADILYCPYPFSAEMEEVSRLSFPSKLTTYFAAGRPILFHGPDMSSPGRYLSKHQAGLIAGSVRSDCLLSHLARYAEDPDLYATMSQRSTERYEDDFSDRTMQERLMSFLTSDGSDGANKKTSPTLQAQGSHAEGLESDVVQLDHQRGASERLLRQAFGESDKILRQGLDRARDRNDALQGRLDDLEKQRDRLAVALAQSHDEKRVDQQVRDHYGRHVIALEELLDQTRRRASALEIELGHNKNRR